MTSKLSLIIILFILVSSCGGGDESSTNTPSANPELDPNLSGLQPYISAGPYASSLVQCVSIVNVADSCSLNSLPPIGFNNQTPVINDILNHLVVSHPWMGDRMRDLLEIMPADMLLMLRSATAIVIHADIRPAYFWQLTGAIYIDPAFLWLTNTEKATVNQQQDFRSSFGDELQFKRLWRYIINNDYAWDNYALDGTEVRTKEDTLVLTTWLFYHELAHANDCMPPSEIATLTAANSYYTNYLDINNSGRCVHDRLVAQDPLLNNVWQSLAGVLYQGDDATPEQKVMTPEYVAAEFITDVANDTYSYSSIWEDTAMVFEAIMMKKNFNADRDIVIVPFYDTFTCEEALVKWGQRGRLGEAVIIERAKFVLSEILPEVDFTAFFASQPTPTEMQLDSSYCTTDLSNNLVATKQQTTESMQYRLKNQLNID